MLTGTKGTKFATLYNTLVNDGKYTKSFEEFNDQFGSDEGSQKLYGALNNEGAYSKSYDEFKSQFEVGQFDNKKLKAIIAATPKDSSIKVEGDKENEDSDGKLTVADKEQWGIGNVFAEDFADTQEKNTWLEDIVGKNTFTDGISDVWRAIKSGYHAGTSVNESWDLYKEGNNMTEEQLRELVARGREMENAGQTDEQLLHSKRMEVLKEKYGGVGAFMLGWAENPSTMALYTTTSLTQMAVALFDSEEVIGTAAAGSGAGAAAGAGVGAGVGAFAGGVGAAPGAVIGAKMGAIGGFMGGLSGAMETGMTTSQLLQESATEAGYDWGSMNDEQRINWIKEVTNDKEKFDDIKSKALARGITIGAIDGVTGAISMGAGSAISKAVSKTAYSAFANRAAVASVAGIETAGGMASEYYGQKAAGQEFNLEEIMIEGFADKTFTAVQVAKTGLKEPKYMINGQARNGKEFLEDLKMMDDEAYVGADIKIENSPAVEKLFNNRVEDINTDLDLDSKISGVEDRTRAIQIERELSKLNKNKSQSAKNQASVLKQELSDIQEKYAYSNADVSIENRKQAISRARDNKFEQSFNKNLKPYKKAAQKQGRDINVYDTTDDFNEAQGNKISNKEFGKDYNQLDDSQKSQIDSMRVDAFYDPGDGNIYIDKQRAKEVGSVSQAAHEFLHPVMNALVGDSVAQGKLVKSFKSKMTSKQRKWVQSELENRGYDPSEWSTEYFNVFTDGILNGDINYDQTFFEQAKDYVEKIFKGAGFDNISFEDGRGMYNFMREYAANGYSKKADQAIKAAEKKTGRSVKNSRSKKQQDIQTSRNQQAEDVNNIYKNNQDKTTAGFLIAEKYRGMAEAVFDRYINGGNVTQDQRTVMLQNKEDIISMMLYDKIPNQKADSKARNVLGLVLDFDAVKNEYGLDGVAGYINKYFSSRALEVFAYYVPDANMDTIYNEDGSVKRYIDGKVAGTLTTETTQDTVGRVKRSFTELETTDEAAIDEAVGTIIAEKVIKMIKLGTYKATDIHAELDKLLNSEIRKAITSLMGNIKNVKGEILVSQEYKDWLDANYDIIVNSLELDVIKKKYGKLFQIEEIGKVDKKNLKKDNPNLKKDSNYRISKFKIKRPTRSAFIKFFTEGGYTTLLARQKSLAMEIASELTRDEVNKLANSSPFINELIEISKMSNKQVSELILENEFKSLAEGLNRAKVVTDTNTFDNLQFSKKLSRDNKLSLLESMPAIIKHVNENGLGLRTLKTFLKKELGWSQPQITALSKKIKDAIEKFHKVENVETIDKANINEFIVDEVFKENDGILNILKEFVGETSTPYGIIQKIGNLNWKGLFRIDKFRERSRETDIAYAEKIILKKGKATEAGLLKVLKWLTKHTTTAGQNSFIKRKQVFAGNPDFINRLNEIDGVNIVTKWSKEDANGVRKMSIDFDKSRLNGEPLSKTTYNKDGSVKKEGFKKLLEAKPQSAKDSKGNVSRDTFYKDFKKRKAESQEAWDTLIGYLDFMYKQVKDPKVDFSVLDFTGKLISLNSNMSTMLRSAANVQYYFVQPDGKPFTGTLVYEHLIPASFIVSKLAQHYAQKLAGLEGLDLNKLHSKYKVAIIPKIMDDSVGILRKSRMSAAWDFMTDSELDRYFDDVTRGMRNIFAVENLETGDIIGQDHADISDLQYSRKQINTINNYNKFIQFSRVPGPRKGISVIDFDDTLAFSDSMIIVKWKDGNLTKMTPAEFAKQSENIADIVESFDFSEFNKVKNGKKGPFFNRAKSLKDKFGNKDIFILTARPQKSAPAIRAFLAGVGLDIKLENIVGLEDGRPKAKADWILSKVAEGYNDFLFADDAIKNVKAVAAVLDQVDVKSDVQQARVEFSKNMGRTFDEILEENKGVKADEIFSEARARTEGKKKRWEFWLPPGAEDFKGLLYYFLGKGKVGEKQMDFFNETLIKPFARAMTELARIKQAYANNFKALKKKYPDVRKRLSKKSPYGNFSFDDAIRVYLWTKLGYEIPGVNKQDVQALVDIVVSDPDLKAFADGLDLISKDRGYPKPGENWTTGNTAQDMKDLSDKVSRKELLAEWIKNKNEIFTKERLNKIEAIYGENFRSALEDILYRMENGTNRVYGSKNKLVNAFSNWINNSVGAIMFFNMRSALLQTISFVNFINWSDNNPAKFGAAILNTKQFAKDFVRIFNSDLLKQRRSGLGYDINEAEIAEALAGSRNGPAALLRYLLRVGFTPTQVADSFAISLGGATFYRNRINTYLKQGLSRVDAEAKAFEDFATTSEESQQSARPDMISQQQAGPLGRLILAFQNTPMQYMRLTKKAFLDIKNGRGDLRTNVSKIIYYTAIQNIIFTAMQSALFALLFANDEEDEEILDKKGMRVANNMTDTILRGGGIYGAVASTAKNMILKFVEQEKKGFRADHAYTMIEMANLSPPIGSKLRKIYSATQTYKFNRDEIAERGFHISNPAYQAIGNVVSGVTNVPLDRLFNKINNLRAASNNENETWQRIANVMGWNTWDIGSKLPEDVENRKSKPSRKRKKKVKKKKKK